MTGLDTDLNNDNTQDIWWQRVGDNQIKGFLDQTQTQLAVTLDLTNPGIIAAGTSGNVTVKATLSDNLKHVLGNDAQVSSLGSVNVQAIDTDNDVATGQVNLTVKDDVPVARGDTASTIEGENLNAVFILDFSGSIDNSELNTMLNAVKTAGQTLFNGTSGDVKLQIVAFSSTAISYGPFTSYASFASQIDAINGNNRPLNGGTDFTAAIQTTMASWAPISGWSNQAFFISDGNPTEQTGSNGNSLSNAVAPLWNTFVDSNGIDVTAIGIGDGINNTRLQEIDLDGLGTPIAVANFSGLITALLAEISGNAGLRQRPDRQRRRWRYLRRRRARDAFSRSKSAASPTPGTAPPAPTRSTRARPAMQMMTSTAPPSPRSLRRTAVN